MEVIKHDFHKDIILVYNKMSSVIPFTFNAVKLYVVPINGQPWVREIEVCKAVKHSQILIPGLQKIHVALLKM